MKELALLDTQNKIHNPEIECEDLSRAISHMDTESRSHLASPYQAVLGGASIAGMVGQEKFEGDVRVR